MKNAQLLVIPLILGVALWLRPSLAPAGESGDSQTGLSRCLERYEPSWGGICDGYDDSQSHPLRVIGYMLHPVGVALEWTIFRPFHLLVSGSPEREYLFGHRPHPPLFAEPQPLQDYGMSRKVPLQEAAAPKPAAAPPPVPERVKIIEVPVEKIVIKEVSKVVEKVVEVEKVVFPDVAFRFDSAELTDLGKGKVYLTAQKLKEKSDVTVVVEGHTDQVGSESYNERLGLQRAQKVMNELVQLGLNPERISAVTLGETKPLIDQQTNWARAVNRRVEFQVKAP